MSVKIRNATLDDVKEILEIYSYYVEHTAISFEYVTPSKEEFIDRMKNVMAKYPYLVAVEDEKIVGYAYAHPFVGREAYKYSAELTIYLKFGETKKGTGRKLYEKLEEELSKMEITNLYACIGDPITEDEFLTRNSENFHARMGFVKVGTFHKCGYKFNRWYNMIWMEKIILSL